METYTGKFKVGESVRLIDCDDPSDVKIEVINKILFEADEWRIYAGKYVDVEEFFHVEKLDEPSKLEYYKEQHKVSEQAMLDYIDEKVK